MTRWTGTVVAVAISDMYHRPSSAWKKIQANPSFNWEGSIFKTLSAPISKQKSQTPTVSLQNSFKIKKLNRVFKKPAKVSPVEFTTIGLLVFTHKDTLTMAQLSDAIAKMRDDVRATYVDIRMNSRVVTMTDD